MKKIAMFFLVIFLTACQESQSFDEASATQEILDLHHVQRAYHFEKKAEEFAGMMSADFISVNGGIVSRPTYEENLQRFGNYFGSVEFIKWDDLSEPVIRFSEDGSLAYTIVDKEVILQYETEEGNMLKDTTHFAWTAIYRKGKDGWKIESIASTNE